MPPCVYSFRPICRECDRSVSASEEKSTALPDLCLGADFGSFKAPGSPARGPGALVSNQCVFRVGLAGGVVFVRGLGLVWLPLVATPGLAAGPFFCWVEHLGVVCLKNKKNKQPRVRA